MDDGVIDGLAPMDRVEVGVTDGVREGVTEAVGVGGKVTLQVTCGGGGGGGGFCPFGWGHSRDRNTRFPYIDVYLLLL